MDEMIRDALYSMLVIAGYAVVAALAVASLDSFGFVIGRFSDWGSVATMFLFFGVISCYFLLRYLTWVLKDYDWTLFGLELILIGGQAVLVTNLQQGAWVISLLVASIIFLVLSVSYVLFVVRPSVAVQVLGSD
jgi:hypothetical protein